MWSTDEMTFERIDIFESPDEYDYNDTSNCIAAYYKSGSREFFYKSDELIKRVLSTKNQASLFKAKMTTEFKNEDGKIVTIQEKEDASIGMKYSIKQVFGLPEYEYYQTPSTILEIPTIQKDRGIDVAPINKSDYMAYSAVNDTLEYLPEDDAEYYPLDYLIAKYHLEHIEECDYVVVDSYATYKKRLKEWADAPTKVKGVDLETTGVQTGMFGQDCITGIVLSYSEDDSTYFPFRQEKCPYNLPISCMQEIFDTINNQPKDVIIVGHNAKFEIEGVWKEHKDWIKHSEYAANWAKAHNDVLGLRRPWIRIDADTFILSILTNPVFKRGTHTLKSLANRVTGLQFLELENVFKDKKNIRFNVLPPEYIRYYACPDTANTIRVYNFLIKLLPLDELNIFKLENELLYVTACNEFFGMRTDQDVLVDSIENEEYKVKTLSDYFMKIHRIKSNINSNDVRRDIFYNKLRCPVEVRTKTGQPSTSNEALKRIVELGTLKEVPEGKEVPKSIVDLHKKEIVKGIDLAKNKFPSLVILQGYAKAMKELGAFKRILRKSLKNRVMFNLNQAGAASGRQTSDAHQYSDGMKKLVLPDSEDHRLWSADFKQIELRILAYLAGEEPLIELESNMDIDIHRAILSIITKKPVWAISAKERKEGKSTNFGVVYMMSAHGLAKKNAGPAYTKADLMKAYDAINGFYNGLPKIKQFVESNKEFILKNGFIKTKMGRYRYFKEILNPGITEREKASKIRAGNNTPVQGFGADYLKIVECKIYDYIKSKGWDELVDCDGVMLPKVRIMLSIHDEVLVSSHKSIPHEEIITMFKVCMELKIKGAPPFFSAPALVNSWYDGKLDQYEIDLRFRDDIVEAWDKDKTRLLHVDTFSDEQDMYVVKQVQKLCKELRGKFLTDADYQDGKLAITNETIQNVIKRLSPEERDMLRKCFVSKHDKVTPSDELGLAIRRAMDKNFSHYIYDLTAFRNNRLKEYMQSLIKQYKTPEEVAAHVDHPELTHTLIAVEIKKDEKFEHLEAIKEATKRYMSKLEEGAEQTEVIMGIEVEDRLEDAEILQSFDQLEEFIEFDENGEAIINENLLEDEDDVYTITNSSVNCEDTLVQQTYAMYMLTDVGVDLLDFKAKDPRAEAIYQELIKLSNPKNPYRLAIFIEGKKLDTNYKLPYIPEIIDNIVTKYKLQEEVV